MSVKGEKRGEGTREGERGEREEGKKKKRGQRRESGGEGRKGDLRRQNLSGLVDMGVGVRGCQNLSGLVGVWCMHFTSSA